jgi:hypothetical protein
VVREARSATISWGVQQQQNIPTVSRLDRSLVLAVRDKGPFALEAEVDNLVALHGSQVKVPLKLTRLWADFKSPVRLQPINLPIRANFQQINFTPGKDKATLVFNVPNNVPPGVYTVVVRAQAQFIPGKGKKVRRRQNVFIVQPASPVTITVLPRQLASVNVNPNSVKLKPGTQTEVMIRITNRYPSYAGGYKVQLVTTNKEGVFQAKEIAISPGQNQAKLVIEAKEEATPGMRDDRAVIRVIGMINGKPVTQDTRLSLSVVK